MVPVGISDCEMALTPSNESNGMTGNGSGMVSLHHTKESSLSRIKANARVTSVVIKYPESMLQSCM